MRSIAEYTATPPSDWAPSQPELPTQPPTRTSCSGCMARWSKPRSPSIAASSTGSPLISGMRITATWHWSHEYSEHRRIVIPPTLAGFRAYFGERLGSPEIGVTEPAREVADVILGASSLPAPLRLIAPAHRLSTAALLPPRLREEYGLGWGVGKALVLRGEAHSIRLAAAPLLLVSSRLSAPKVAFPR